MLKSTPDIRYWMLKSNSSFLFLQITENCDADPCYNNATCESFNTTQPGVVSSTTINELFSIVLLSKRCHRHQYCCKMCVLDIIWCKQAFPMEVTILLQCYQTTGQENIAFRFFAPAEYPKIPSCKCSCFKPIFRSVPHYNIIWHVNFPGITF